MSLADRIKHKASELGFTFCALIPAQPSRYLAQYEAWLHAGHHAEMGYLARPDSIARRADLSLTVPGAQSVVVLAANYHTQHLPPHILNDPARGIIASYAWQIDYHNLLTPRLYEFQNWIAAQVEAESGQAVAGRAYVDTGPVLERELAEQAGLGFIGKNTCLINPKIGSYLFLAEIILDCPLPFDPPPPAPVGTCGQCTRCLTACPTDAFVAPKVLDSRLCISYLTIELKTAIPEQLRPLLGNRIFGCDICQEVCPYNRQFAIPCDEPAFQATLKEAAPPLLDLIAVDEAAFRAKFKDSPLKRSKRRGLLRNVAVALGNWGSEAALLALQEAAHDSEPLIREHARWGVQAIQKKRNSTKYS